MREAVTNALVHQDYSIAGTDITLAIYADRLEVASPGRLPNTVTPERMRSGMREHNETEPDLIEEEYRFTVRLRK